MLPTEYGPPFIDMGLVVDLVMKIIGSIVIRATPKTSVFVDRQLFYKTALEGRTCSYVLDDMEGRYYSADEHYFLALHVGTKRRMIKR